MVVILDILAALVVPQVMSRPDQAKITVACGDVKAVSVVLDTGDERWMGGGQRHGDPSGPGVSGRILNRFLKQPETMRLRLVVQGK